MVTLGFLEGLLQVNKQFKYKTMKQNNSSRTNDQLGKVFGECVGTVVTVLLEEFVRRSLRD